MPLTQRYYPLPGLDFRDFWDVCSHYLQQHPRYKSVLYTVHGVTGPICENERDVATVLRQIAQHGGDITGYTARYYLFPNSEPGDYGNARMEYLPTAHDLRPAGLYFFADTDNKLLLYHFEDFIYSSYSFDEEESVEVEYGLPCEVLAVVIDVRGFSTFCEQPDIESPYACGLMTAFYSMVRKGFKRYPADLVKFLGDGVLAVWQTNSKDRRIAIETAIDGLRQLPMTWRMLVSGPEFTHGAPEGVASGVAFGLASRISIDKDYIGRPINLASRLCAVCPPAKTYIARGVPDLEDLPVKPFTVRVKSYGEQKIWLMEQ